MPLILRSITPGSSTKRDSPIMDATARHTTITIRVRSVNIAPDSMCSDLFRFKATIPIMQEKGDTPTHGR